MSTMHNHTTNLMVCLIFRLFSLLLLIWYWNYCFARVIVSCTIELIILVNNCKTQMKVLLNSLGLDGVRLQILLLYWTFFSVLSLGDPRKAETVHSRTMVSAPSRMLEQHQAESWIPTFMTGQLWYHKIICGSKQTRYKTEQTQWFKV